MPRKPQGKAIDSKTQAPAPPAPAGRARASALLDTRVIYCGDCLEQLRNLPDACVDLIYIDPWCEEIEQSFNSNRNYEVFWGELHATRTGANSNCPNARIVYAPPN